MTAAPTELGSRTGDPTAAGEDKLDEATLRTIASTTGGQYSHAGDREALSKIYSDLDALRSRPVETVSHRPRQDLFYVPLVVSIAVSLVYHLLAAWHSGALGIREKQMVPAAALAVLPTFAELEAFHFLRPALLLLLIPIAALAWLNLRRTDSLRNWRRLIDPELLDHLIVGQTEHRRWRPITAFAIVSVLATVAAAGPTWRREPGLFSDDQAVLAIVMKVTPSMLAKDVQPTRLTRAAQKAADLLEERRGTRTALVAYAGSAHLVLPLTADANLVGSFAAELTPDVMPTEGDNPAEALDLAAEQLLKANAPGSILWITDGVPEEADSALAAFQQKSSVPVQILAVAAPADAPVPPDSPPAPPLDRAAFAKAARALDATVTEVTPDETDVNWLARHAVARFASSGNSQAGERWQDFGYWLTFAVAVCMLLWFRPGLFITWEPS